ncbi:hypothetical protein ACOMHN_067363 [Nucella lapillus]
MVCTHNDTWAHGDEDTVAQGTRTQWRRARDHSGTGHVDTVAQGTRARGHSGTGHSGTWHKDTVARGTMQCTSHVGSFLSCFSLFGFIYSFFLAEKKRLS